MKVTWFINDSHLLFIVWNNFYKITHDIGEESNTTKHDDNCHDTLKVWNGEVITVANGTKRRQGVIATHYKLHDLIFVIKFIILDEVVSFIESWIAKVPPETSNEISDDDRNDDQP